MTTPDDEGLTHLLEVETDGEVIPGPAPGDQAGDQEENQEEAGQ